MRAKNLVLLLVAVAATTALLARWRSSAAPSAPPVATAVAQCRVAPGDAAHPGMVWVEGGAFTMGSDHAFPEEAPAVATRAAGFWMDQTEVTNAQFAEFVAATGYLTLAERQAGSAVFRPRGDETALRSLVSWWQFQEGADWQHPQGPQSSIAGREQHPVVHVAYEDAAAYAKWKGRSLPTEDQFEFAAQGGARKNAAGEFAANTWQGIFPTTNTAADGYAGTSPVGCFAANHLGLHDLIGNVWEWTTSPYFARHDGATPAHPRGFDPTQPQEPAVAVVKGGSYLCSPDYCMRYRPEARIGQSLGLGTAHIGFRTVTNIYAEKASKGR